MMGIKSKGEVVSSSFNLIFRKKRASEKRQGIGGGEKKPSSRKKKDMKRRMTPLFTHDLQAKKNVRGRGKVGKESRTMKRGRRRSRRIQAPLIKKIEKRYL